MEIRIGNFLIGEGNPCFVIAEIGINHNGHLGWALKMIDKAKDCGVNAVKIQSFKTEKFMLRSNREFDFIKSVELSFTKQQLLFKAAKKNKTILFSTPEDFESADFLERMRVSAYKIASMDMDYYPFIEHIAKKQKPVILSTGMASLNDIDKTLKVIFKTTNKKVILMHCVSNYPAKINDANLKAIQTLKREFGLPVGFSDHTLGNAAALTAVALGADVIEKHFTLNKKLPGDDHICSADPEDLRVLMKGIRDTEESLGDGIKRPAKSEIVSIKEKKRGLYAKIEIQKGQPITIARLDFLCPAKGLMASELNNVLGRKAKVGIKQGSAVKWSQIA